MKNNYICVFRQHFAASIFNRIGGIILAFLLIYNNWAHYSAVLEVPTNVLTFVMIVSIASSLIHSIVRISLKKEVTSFTPHHKRLYSRLLVVFFSWIVLVAIIRLFFPAKIDFLFSLWGSPLVFLLMVSSIACFLKKRIQNSTKKLFVLLVLLLSICPSANCKDIELQKSNEEDQIYPYPDKYRVRAIIEGNTLRIDSYEEFLFRVTINDHVFSFNNIMSVSFDISGVPEGSDIVIMTDTSCYIGQIHK